MTKLVQNDLASLTNEQSALAALNSNYAALEQFSDTVLSRDGTTPNQMNAALDMNSNRILNLPAPISGEEPLRLTDASILNGGGTIVGMVQSSYVTLANDANLTSERKLTAGTNITITDGGANGNVTVATTGLQPLDADLTALAAQAGTGLATRTAADTWTTRSLTQPAAGITITNPAGVAGNPTFALANDLGALEALAGTGLAAHTAADTWTERSLTQPAAGITITNPGGVAGNPTFALANDLSAVEGLAANGMAARTATDTWAVRTITGTANEITLANGDGVAGNPTVSIPTSVTFTGKTVTGGTFSSPTITNGVDAASLKTTVVASGMAMPINCSFAQSVAASALTVALKGMDGNDPSATNPVLIPFRSSTLTDSKPVWLSVTSALSLVISSGSTMGFTSAQSGRLWLVIFNDANTPRLGLINCLSAGRVFPLQESGVASSTAEGGAGAADSAGVFYTGTAVTSKAYRVIGALTWETALGTAGTWSAVADVIHLHTPSSRLPGQPVQYNETRTGAVATGTTVIPDDDTIPQNTEGDQYMSVVMTPTSAANIWRITANADVAVNASAAVYYSLILNSVANALCAGRKGSWGTNVDSMDNTLDFTLTPANSLVAGTQFTVAYRAGPSAAGTVTFNGSNAARKFGGVLNSFITLQEIMA